MTAARTYDYVIVGGGSAGCVLAGRLSEDPATRVLLLEAGGADGHPYIRIPLGMGKLQMKRMFEWGQNSVPEAGMANRPMRALRGKVLGGGSSINMTAFTRGSAGDFDRWARNGAGGWSWNDVLPYFRRIETWEGGASTLRGGTGPVHVVAAKPNDPLTTAVDRAAVACGYPLTGDYNAQSVGFGRTQFNLHNGRRDSAARAYLLPAMNRHNLTVVTGATARRILLDGTRAAGVEYARAGGVETVRAEREVVLSGGALSSPALLMHSGIGPAEHLRELGIPVVAALPVGNNLQDHVRALVLWKRRGPRSSFNKLMRYDRAGLAMLQALLFGTGPATELPLETQAYIKSSPELEVPDLEFMLRSSPPVVGPYWPVAQKAYTDSWGIDPVLLHPESRGTVRLRSANPADPAIIHFNYFSAPADIAKLREGLRMARAIGESTQLDAFRGDELDPGAGVTSDEDIDQHLRRTATGVSHAAGTCRMGSGEDSVLDPQLRVRGIEGLRVVDASVFPDLVSAHINAAVYMVAEKAADLIKS